MSEILVAALLVLLAVRLVPWVTEYWGDDQ